MNTECGSYPLFAKIKQGLDFVKTQNLKAFHFSTLSPSKDQVSSIILYQLLGLVNGD